VVSINENSLSVAGLACLELVEGAETGSDRLHAETGKTKYRNRVQSKSNQMVILLQSHPATVRIREKTCITKGFQGHQTRWLCRWFCRIHRIRAANDGAGEDIPLSDDGLEFLEPFRRVVIGYTAPLDIISDLSFARLGGGKSKSLSTRDWATGRPAQPSAAVLSSGTRDGPCPGGAAGLPAVP